MRIIGGDAGGRRLTAPEGTETRPTADKTRESLFNILVRRVPDARVLDLFGGTGALALEAMSRGARCAVICDVSSKAAKAIQTQIQTVMKDSPGVRFLKTDYKKALETLAGERFDLVFLDPPYRLTDSYGFVCGYLREHDMLADDGIIVAERSAQAVIAYPEGFTVFDTRNYRDTAVDFLRAEAAQ